MTTPEPGTKASGPRAIAAHTIGHAHTGDVVGLPAEVLTAARDVPAPPRLANLPPVPLCLGRDDDLTWIGNTLGKNNGTAITQAFTVHGLGGIGKTTLALAYAHRQRHAYSLVWWINADSPARIEQSLGDLALKLFPAWAGNANQDQRSAWATTWLQWHPGWLLVFDNVEDPTDLRLYLGALDGGHHLITSRRATGWPPTIHTLPLGTLHPDEAADLICAHAVTDRTPTPRDRQAAHTLAADLGHLPLALEQAGAYLAQHPTIDIDAYRHRLPAKLDKAADGLDAERTIARIWTQTLKALTARNPHAVEILHILAWLAPDDLPISLLETPDVDSDDLHEALGDIAAFSLATVTRETVSVHRLLQRVLRDTADGLGRLPAGRQAAEELAVRAVGQLASSSPNGSSPWDTLIPQLISLALTRPIGHKDDRAAHLYSPAAQHLQNQGHEARTIPLHEAALIHYEEYFHENHLEVLKSRHNLGGAYLAAGNLDQAIATLKTSLAKHEQILGDTHPNTLFSRNSLAGAHFRAGDLNRAIPLYETTLAQREKHLGDTHPQTLTSRNNLASAYQAAGDLEQAIPLFEITLAQREKDLGDTHSSTLTSRNNLAHAYQSAGDLERAIPLYETALAQREKHLGDTHPDTLVSRNNLASAYKSAGNLNRAIPLYETTLIQHEQVLGNSHPNTLTSRDNLATAYYQAGDLDRAIPLFETNLAQSEEFLSATHPNTLRCRNNLALACQKAGDLNRAIEILELNLTQCELQLGKNHPKTLTLRDNLACARDAMSRIRQ
ncbi:FxSxx-COOH system tetratricopeptide repeat protein [Kitasatospora purpeofusca]|uniref:FxSxx-COOH system tetratricopeptide repeat protein n=1 Tax=Kitasatospora purpeofusca TaxID=67352 RepID=UPI0033EDD7AD